MVSPLPSRTLQGGAMIVGAMSIIGLIDNFVLIISEEAGLWQFHLVRSVIGCSVLLLFCRLTRRQVMPKNLRAVVLRSALITVSMMLYFGSLSVLPIAEAGAALFTSPIFILLYSVLLFRVRVGPVRIAAVALGFAGVLVVLRPDPGNLTIVAIFPLFAGMFYGLGQLITRHKCATEETAVLLLWFFLTLGVTGLTGSVILALLPVPESWFEAAPFFVQGWVAPSERFLFWTVIQAAGSLIAVTGLIRGYQIADPTLVAVFEFSFLFFAGIWGWILWRQQLDMFDILGILAIAGGGCLIAVRSNRTI